MRNMKLFAVMLVFVCFACVAGMTTGQKIGRELGYDECIEAVSSYSFRTPNAKYNEGADAMKGAALAQIECYREERK